MKKYANRGFTLIELLVVIAIIGILSSVVLASLSTARNKGKAAAIKGELNSARTQIEVVANGGAYTTSGNSATNCTAAGAISDGTVTAITDAITANGGTVTCSIDQAASASKWAMMSTLPDATNHTFCVDSSGAAIDKTSGAMSGGVCTP